MNNRLACGRDSATRFLDYGTVFAAIYFTSRLRMFPKLTAAGLVLSVIGAILDFAAGFLLLQPVQRGGMDGMGRQSPSAEATVWSTLLFVLGLLLLASGVLGATRVGMARMRLFGGLMVVYGVVMLIIGGLMLGGVSPMMQGTMIYSPGMSVVGIGMAAIGLLMINVKEEYKCSICRIHFPTEEAMIKHNREVHD